MASPRNEVAICSLMIIYLQNRSSGQLLGALLVGVHNQVNLPHLTMVYKWHFLA